MAMTISGWTSRFFANGAQLMPVASSPGQTVLTGRLGAFLMNGRLYGVTAYFENFAGSTTQQSVYYDDYAWSTPLGDLGSSQKDIALSALNPVVVPDYGNQHSTRPLGGDTPNSVFEYWDTRNLDGSYKVSYRVKNLVTGAVAVQGDAFAAVKFGAPPDNLRADRQCRPCRERGAWRRQCGDRRKRLRGCDQRSVDQHASL